MQATSHNTQMKERGPATGQTHDLNLSLRGKWLQRLFWVWIGGSAIVGAYLVLAGPLTPYTGLDDRHVALALPILMVLMLASGLTWLIMLVNSRPKRK